MKSIWIVTKDCRLRDNLVLKNALYYCEELYPVFILDTEQFKNGGYNSIHFLIECLDDLNNSLKQYNSCLHIIDKNNIQNFISYIGINSAYILKGFTSFEKERNNYYKSIVNLNEIDDLLGMPREYFLKSDGNPYKVFGPYCREVIRKGGLPLSDNTIPDNIIKCKKIDGYNTFNFMSLSNREKLKQANWIGGETEGQKLIENRYYNFQLFQLEKQYGKNIIIQNGYIKKERKDISPHIKFGTISPRLVYHIGLVEHDINDINKEYIEGKGILWRALYYNLFDQNIIIVKNLNIKWYNDFLSNEQWNYYFNLWSTGNTGYDFVDAGIHQLLKTGIMDNEVRMLVANFLVFGMGINWRFGEEFFRIHLVDYDWPLNVCNWAWSAQVGIDNPSPNKTYNNKAIRIFNPNTYKTKTKNERIYREEYILKWLNRQPNSLQKSVDFDMMMRYMLQFY